MIHNPEFTTIECYAAYYDYFDMMNLVEEMYAWVANRVCVNAGSSALRLAKGEFSTG